AFLHGQGFKQVIKQNSRSYSGEKKRWLVIVAIAWRQGDNEVRVANKQGRQHADHVTESTVAPAEQNPSHSHDGEKHVILRQQQLVYIKHWLVCGSQKEERRARKVGKSRTHREIKIR